MLFQFPCDYLSKKAKKSFCEKHQQIDNATSRDNTMFYVNNQTMAHHAKGYIAALCLYQHSYLNEPDSSSSRLDSGDKEQEKSPIAGHCETQ